MEWFSKKQRNATHATLKHNTEPCMKPLVADVSTYILNGSCPELSFKVVNESVREMENFGSA